ncbi:cytochrome P450 2J5-like [Babylonia areolata]|uniref:cytochrome P450 2J5-like n=1 Tax=Babylonia areolata TaxID=304850 RepID=UPI003FD1BBFB
MLDVTTCLVFVVVFLCVWLVQRSKHGNQSVLPLPPSPPLALPLVGHLYLMPKDPREQLKTWRQQYGDIFHLQFGSHILVVISSYQWLKEAFVDFGDFFSQRPDVFTLNEVGKKRGVALSSGETWKEQRKVALDILRELGLGKNILAQKIQEEVVEYLKELEEENGQAFDPCRRTHHGIANIICSVVFGQRYEHGDPFFTKCLSALQSNMRDVGGDASILNFMPYLRFLPGDLFHLKRIARNASLLDKFCLDIYLEHLQRYDENCIDDFISAYIREMKRKEAAGEPTTLNEKNLLQVVGDLFGAGTETTASTICWAIAYFLHYPQVQEKCFQEIQDKIGSGRLPTLQDKLDLPYLEATIMEVQRKVNIVPFGILRSVSQDFVFHDYLIPKDAVIMPLMESALSDDQMWGDPEAFRPERFLDGSGKCIHPAQFIPFSLGRRMCLGESLAKMELFLFLSAMIQRFIFLPPEDGTLPSLQGILGITVGNQPFKMRALPRK